MPGWDFAHARDEAKSECILKDIFSLGTAQMIDNIIT